MVDIEIKLCILVAITTKFPVMPFRTETDWKEEDSLENTFNCVPKVQGVC